MAKKSSLADVVRDVDPSTQAAPIITEPGTPFRILILGDFGGGPRARAWQPVEIDRHNFDEVLASFGVGLPKRRMKFREIDDFHPDQIYRGPLFQAMREVRSRLERPATFADAAAEVRGWRGIAASHAPASMHDGVQPFAESGAAPSIVTASSPDIAEARAQFAAEASDRMRAVLHDPKFQALEAAWRAVFRLLRAVETGLQLKIYLLDLTRAEWEADLNSTADLHRTKTWRMLVEKTGPWSVVAGNYAFETTPGDALLLGRIGRIMQAAGAPFLAEADARHEASDEWLQLRSSPAASWIGLAIPRFLLRAPYGKDSEPIDSFEFEEMQGVAEHGNYLWGNPAFACVQILAEAFSDSGWDMSPEKRLIIGGLPLHVFEADGEKQLKPCAETLLTERDTEWILKQGFMPLVSIQDRDAVRLLRFQSIAGPPAPLAGRWG